MHVLVGSETIVFGEDIISEQVPSLAALMEGEVLRGGNRKVDIRVTSACLLASLERQKDCS